MFRVFPQDLKAGDILLWESVEAHVLSLKDLEKNIEVNVRLPDGDLRNWTFSKSHMLEILSSEEQRALDEPTAPFFRGQLQYGDLGEADTDPVGGLSAIPSASKCSNS